MIFTTFFSYSTNKTASRALFMQNYVVWKRSPYLRDIDHTVKIAVLHLLVFESIWDDAPPFLLLLLPPPPPPPPPPRNVSWNNGTFPTKSVLLSVQQALVHNE